MSGDAVTSGRAVKASDQAELEAERDFLLRSLDDLDVEFDAGDLEPKDYLALKEDYTARAAAVLRRLQRMGEPSRGETDPSIDGATSDGNRIAPPPPERRESSGPATGAPRSRGQRLLRSVVGARVMVLGIVFTVVVAGGAGYLVTRSSGERLPGMGMTAGPDQSALTVLSQAIAIDNSGKLVEAAKLYDAVLAKEPANVVALSRRGWVLGRSGRQAGNVELLKAALGYLDRATSVDPSYADAHAFRGLILGALARPGESGCEFRLWLAIAPVNDEQRPAIEGVLEEATKQAGGTLPACPNPPTPTPVTTNP